MPLTPLPTLLLFYNYDKFNRAKLTILGAISGASAAVSSHFWNEATAAILGATLGGTGLAIINRLLNRGERKFNEAERIRTELRQDLDTMRTRLAQVERDLDEWKKRYFDLEIKHTELHGEYTSILAEVKLIRGSS